MSLTVGDTVHYHLSEEDIAEAGWADAKELAGVKCAAIVAHVHQASDDQGIARSEHELYVFVPGRGLFHRPNVEYGNEPGECAERRKTPVQDPTT